jgi:Xaa-Pro dipeptidase
MAGDESPYKLIATIFKDAGILSGSIAIEERVRFLLLDGIRKEASHLNYVSADPVTIPCRIIKSANRTGADAKSYRHHAVGYTIWCSPKLKEGMAPSDLLLLSIKHRAN